MPEFVLKYKEGLREQALEIAEAVRLCISQRLNLPVAYEVLQFSPDTCDQPHFLVKGQATENPRVGLNLDALLKAQAAGLETMQNAAFEDQVVECWWWLVQGKWGGEKGLRKRD